MLAGPDDSKLTAVSKLYGAFRERKRELIMRHLIAEVMNVPFKKVTSPLDKLNDV